MSRVLLPSREVIALRQKRRQLQILHALAERLQQRATLARNGDGTAAAERSAIRLETEARALRWALSLLESATKESPPSSEVYLSDHR